MIKSECLAFVAAELLGGVSRMWKYDEFQSHSYSLCDKTSSSRAGNNGHRIATDYQSETDLPPAYEVGLNKNNSILFFCVFII